MEIDFGGIGKEYAADRVATICLEHGLRHGLVNLGGDIRAIGPQADGTPWRVGIRHPRVQDAAIAGFDLAAGALATSGDYERYFEIDGKRYCHILNPTTGMPVDALAIGQRGGAAVRGRRQLRDDRDAARSATRRRSSTRRPVAVARRGARRNAASRPRDGQLRPRVHYCGAHMMTPIGP